MILNLTQHPATPEQADQGVQDLPGGAQQGLKALLTFDSLPSAQEIEERAAAIAELAASVDLLASDDADSPPPHAAMIGGAGYLLPALERHLRGYGIEPLQAFTRREVVEVAGADGAVIKTAVFRHIGWVRTE